MNLRKTAVIGSALIALVGLLSFPRLLLGSDHAQSEGINPASLRPMPSPGGEGRIPV